MMKYDVNTNKTTLNFDKVLSEYTKTWKLLFSITITNGNNKKKSHSNNNYC